MNKTLYSVNATILLDPKAKKGTDVVRWVHVTGMKCGLRVGWFRFGGIMRECIGVQDRDGFVEMGETFPANLEK